MQPKSSTDGSPGFLKHSTLRVTKLAHIWPKAMGRKGCRRENDVSPGLSVEKTSFLTNQVTSYDKVVSVVEGESSGCPVPCFLTRLSTWCPAVFL